MIETVKDIEWKDSTAWSKILCLVKLEYIGKEDNVSNCVHIEFLKCI